MQGETGYRLPFSLLRLMRNRKPGARVMTSLELAARKSTRNAGPVVMTTERLVLRSAAPGRRQSDRPPPQ